jgi:hypothetical protein
MHKRAQLTHLSVWSVELWASAAAMCCAYGGLHGSRETWDFSMYLCLDGISFLNEFYGTSIRNVTTPALCTQPYSRVFAQTQKKEADLVQYYEQNGHRYQLHTI